MSSLSMHIATIVFFTDLSIFLPVAHSFAQPSPYYTAVTQSLATASEAVASDCVTAV